MVEVLISEGALVVALIAVLTTLLRTKRAEDTASKREMEYRTQIAAETKAILAEGITLRNVEEERLKERLRGLLQLAPDIERLVLRAREAAAAERLERGEPVMPSTLTGGHNRYTRGEIE